MHRLRAPRRRDHQSCLSAADRHIPRWRAVVHCEVFDHVQSLRAACTRGAEKGADEAGAHVFDPASTAAGSIRAFAGRGGHLAACRGEDDQEVDQEAPPPQDERPEPILEERLRELSWLLM